MAEPEYEFNLKTAKQDILNWKTRFFRKNSKHPAKICVRCFYAPEHICFWKYFLEIAVNGKIVEQYRIQKVVFDTFDYDKTLPRVNYSGIEIIVLHEFKPSGKEAE